MEILVKVEVDDSAPSVYSLILLVSPSSKISWKSFHKQHPLLLLCYIMITDKATDICDTSWTVSVADLYIEQLWSVKQSSKAVAKMLHGVDIDKDNTSGINRTLRHRLYCSYDMIMIMTFGSKKHPQAFKYDHYTPMFW